MKTENIGNLNYILIPKSCVMYWKKGSVNKNERNLLTFSNKNKTESKQKIKLKSSTRRTKGTIVNLLFEFSVRITSLR